MNSSLMPWMRWLPTFLPVRRVGELAGSSGWMRTLRPLLRRCPRHAHDRAAGADAGHEGVRLPAQLGQLTSISGPVVSSWASTLSGFANWQGRKARGFSFAYSSVIRTEPTNPPWALDTGITSAPRPCISWVRSRLC